MSEIQYSELTNRIFHAVERGTWRLLQNTEISIRDRIVTIKGVAPSFYVKQLTLEAIKACLHPERFKIHLEVSVHAN